MLLLHLSDIHFRSPDCLHAATDPDRPFRSLLEWDLRDKVEELGPVDAILIGGDVAFKGADDEYGEARKWINRLLVAARCSTEQVFVVPGNHDVDRAVVTGQAVTRNAQDAIARCNRPERERELRTHLREQAAAAALLAPLAAYNRFAAPFGCQIFAPEQLYWQADLPLDGEVVLRLNGLTSTLLSGGGDRDLFPGKLYLSPLQTVLDPEEDVVHLVMCHHPPDWFDDSDEVDDAVNERAAIHLFGHKHRQRYRPGPKYVRFSAGAVNPDRREADWKPGYNLVRISVDGTGRDRTLQVEAHLRELQASPQRFRAIRTEDDEDVFRHVIRIPSRIRSVPAVTPPPPPEQVVRPSSLSASIAVPEVPVTGNDARHIVSRFWKLPMSERRAVARTLGLLEAGELDLPEPERYGRVLRRAGALGRLGELDSEIAKLETR